MVLGMNTDYFPKLHLLVGVILDEEFVICEVATGFMFVIYVNVIFEGLMLCGTRTKWRRMIWWELVMKSGNSALIRCNSMQLFIYCKITLHVSCVHRTHHQEYIKM